jgi:hypothetical protein
MVLSPQSLAANKRACSQATQSPPDLFLWKGGVGDKKLLFCDYDFFTTRLRMREIVF